MTVLPLHHSAAATEVLNGWKPVEAAKALESSELDLEIPANLTVPQFLFDSRHFARLDHYPDAPWIVDSVSGRPVARDELRDRTRALAQAISVRYDIGRDENPVVCVISVNHVDYPTTVWASHLLGAAVFTTNPAFTAEEFALQFSAAKPSLFFVQQEVLATVREAATACGIQSDRIIVFNAAPNASIPEAADKAPLTIQELVNIGLDSDPSSFREHRLAAGEGKTKTAILFPSSGTTGVPKLISVSHYAFIANVLQAAVYNAGTAKETIPVARRRYRPGDVSLAVLPFFHILGLLINLHHALYSGMTVVIAPKFSLGATVKTIEKHKITHLLLVPPMVVLFTKKLGVDVPELRSVRMVSVAGAPLNNDLVTRFSQSIPQSVIGQIYGMTEAGALTAPSLTAQVATPGEGATSASVGKLLPGVVWKVIRADGGLAERGEKGELWVKTPSMAAGYHQNLESWADTFVDGWLRSGDEVYLNDSDEMFVVQRLKDFMKVKGFRVNPEELESQLLKHADVADCCVVPIPDEFSGELPKAFVVLTQDARSRIGTDAAQSEKLQAALIQFIAEHKVTYKHLGGGIEFLDVIPKTASGKILRRLLRDSKPAQA
ncbi:acetyl-CoA synthetase-like protein [Mycena albidolilacea]|uniref:Acetyl-CoA synthetase-like protein n=1 Tax=Mycena albidolilacea TaxID=1033008 RepID=A0AAD7ETI0_9AGAR|nr:acetyl-CoA synthetase-like protein [Mycena albidolilacea]